MPVGLLIAIEFSEPTSHGFTSSDSNVVLGSVGAKTAALDVTFSVAFCRPCDFILEGTDVRGTDGKSSFSGETFRRFLEEVLSRESESESDESCNESEILSRSTSDPDSSSDKLEARVEAGFSICGAIL